MWIIRQQQETQEYPDYADLRVACKSSSGNIGELEWLLGDISEVLKLPPPQPAEVREFHTSVLL